MIILEAVNLNRKSGCIGLKKPVRTEREFHALHVVARGLDQLLAGEEPDDPEFVEFAMGSPQVLSKIPTAGKTQ
jgi:hypothetical protein